MTGALADLKVWVMDTGEPELESKFRELLGLVRRNGISDFHYAPSPAWRSGGWRPEF